ncbi:MAG: hypothetical protein ACK55I_37000, partial [bacterium]
MVRGDPGQRLGVQPAGIGFGEPADLVPKGRLGMAAGDVAVDLREVVALDERRCERALAGGR